MPSLPRLHLRHRGRRYAGVVWTLLLLQLVFSPSARPEPLLLPAKCLTQTLQEMLYPPFPDTDKLNDIPTLKNWINTLLADPLTPDRIKRIIRRALEQNLTAIQLTRTIKNEWGIHNVNALYRSVDKKFVVLANGNAELSYNRAAAKFKPKQTPFKHILFMQQRPLSAKANDVVALVHEMSHVKFNVFLEDHLPRLIDRFPDDLVRRLGNGEYVIDQEFYAFLLERYAFETEYALLKSAYGRHFDEWARAERYGSGPGLMSDAEMSRSISQKVIDIYKIKDPRVLQMKDRTIHDILTRGVKPPEP